MLDPLGVADLVLRALLLTGFTCLFRPNSYHRLKWRYLSFLAEKDEDGILRIEETVSVLDSKAVAYASALEGLARRVTLFEFGIRDLCAVRTYVALGKKLGVFDYDLRETCKKYRFVVKPLCLDFFVFLAVEGEVLTPTKIVSWWLRGVVRFIGGVGSLILYSYTGLGGECVLTPTGGVGE